MSEQWFRMWQVTIRTTAPSALSCRQVASALHPYLDGQLDCDAALAVAAHLEACGRCRREAESFRMLKQALRRQQAACDAQIVARLHEFGRRICTGEFGADGNQPGTPAERPPGMPRRTPPCPDAGSPSAQSTPGADPTRPPSADEAAFLRRIMGGMIRPRHDGDPPAFRT